LICVVDASVVVKCLIPEPDSLKAAEVMRYPVTAPDLLVPECLNALWKKFRRGELREDQVLRGAHALQIAGVTLEPTQPLAMEAIVLSLRLRYPAYDCVYLALARKIGGELVTADEKLIMRCLQPDAADLALRVRALRDFTPMIQERAVRPYMPRRRAA
jgi:predicted nucleic acid-binding protein